MSPFLIGSDQQSLLPCNCTETTEKSISYLDWPRGNTIDNNLVPVKKKCNSFRLVIIEVSSEIKRVVVVVAVGY